MLNSDLNDHEIDDVFTKGEGILTVYQILNNNY